MDMRTHIHAYKCHYSKRLHERKTNRNHKVKWNWRWTCLRMQWANVSNDNQFDVCSGPISIKLGTILQLFLTLLSFSVFVYNRILIIDRLFLAIYMKIANSHLLLTNDKHSSNQKYNELNEKEILFRIRVIFSLTISVTPSMKCSDNIHRIRAWNAFNHVDAFISRRCESKYVKTATKRFDFTFCSKNLLEYQTIKVHVYLGKVVKKIV